MWSCMLWMVRDRRRYAMLSSPFMVAYGNLLIVLQYIWSFENMEPISGLFVKKNNPFHSLSSKVWEWKSTDIFFKIFFFGLWHSQHWPLFWVTTCNLKIYLWFNVRMDFQCNRCILYAANGMYFVDSKTKHCYTVEGRLVFWHVLELLKVWPNCVLNEILYINRPPQTLNLFLSKPGYCFVKPCVCVHPSRVRRCNYISRMSQTVFYKIKVYFKCQMNATHAWKFRQFNLSLETQFWFMFISLCLFWPPILCSQQVKVNGNDLLVHLFFSCWWSVCRNTLFIVCRSCVCWASGCCWDKLSQRDGKNKRRTVLVFQTFMWRIRRRRVITGILFYFNYSRHTVNSSPVVSKVGSWRGFQGSPAKQGIIYFQYNYSIRNTMTECKIIWVMGFILFL